MGVYVYVPHHTVHNMIDEVETIQKIYTFMGLRPAVLEIKNFKGARV